MKGEYIQKKGKKNTSTAVGNSSLQAIQLQDNRPKTVLQQKQAEQNTIQKKENNTGLPDNLKSGIENLSGHSMDDVKVHYNSSQPAQLNAHAYAQGNQIHVAPGQEKHLPHEAWHVVQQKQGRVKPTKQLKSKVNINDDAGLEKEADVMGAKAVQVKASTNVSQLKTISGQPVVQRLPKFKEENEAIIYFEEHLMDDFEANEGEIEELVSLGKKKGWGDLLERISYYKKEQGPSKSENWKVFNGLNKKDPASLPQLIIILERAQENDWTDLEEKVLPFVRRLEDERDFGIEKGGPSYEPSHGKEKKIKLEPKIKKLEILDLAPKTEQKELSEKELEGNKTNSRDGVFRAMLASSGKHFEENEIQGFLKIAEDAHDLSVTAQVFTNNQHQYQNLLIKLGLSLETIMNFNRSAGFEYEFSRFYDMEDKSGDQKKEVLRSHILLASGGAISGLFGLGFRLETDSNNSLEMVTPPFLFLVSAQTKQVLKATHTLFEQAVTKLKGVLEISGKNPISDYVGEFEALGFGPGWKWYMTQKILGATNMHAKHSGVYGQLNVSLTPTEIVNLIPKLMEIEGAKVGTLVGGSLYTPSKPVALFNQIFPVMWKISNDEQALKGVLGLYARSVSNILGIPSVLYRIMIKERPEAGNYATDVKESLGIWVKDFAYQVIDSYIKSHPQIKEAFILSVTKTEGFVWKDVSLALNANLVELEENYMNPIRSFYANKIESLKTVKLQMIADAKKVLELKPEQELPSEEMKKVTQVFMKRMQGWDGEKVQVLNEKEQYIKELLKYFYQQAEKEYVMTVKLMLAALEGQQIPEPKPTRRDQDEAFGEGTGVRKETYLGKLPGKRNLRVAELRSSDDLPSLEEEINK